MTSHIYLHLMPRLHCATAYRVKSITIKLDNFQQFKPFCRIKADIFESS